MDILWQRQMLSLLHDLQSKGPGGDFPDNIWWSFIRLACSSDTYGVAQTINSSELLEAMWTHQAFSELKSAVALNPHLSTSIADAAVGDADLAEFAALNPRICEAGSTEHLLRAATSGRGDIALRFAGNPSISREFAVQLASSGDPSAIAALARNDAVPLEIFSDVDCSNVDLNRALVERVELTDEIAERLIKSKRPDVLVKATDRLDKAEFERVLNALTPAQQSRHTWLARSPWCPPSVLAGFDQELLSAEEVTWIASHRNLPEELMGDLVASPDVYIRAALAANVSAPAAIRLRLLDDDRPVRRAAARSEVLSVAEQGVLAADADVGVRVAIASRADITKGVAAQLIGDAEPAVRDALFQNRQADINRLDAPIHDAVADSISPLKISMSAERLTEMLADDLMCSRTVATLR